MFSAALYARGYTEIVNAGGDSSVGLGGAEGGRGGSSRECRFLLRGYSSGGREGGRAA